MDALKAVPQFFFDVIGRVVPGSMALLLLHLAFDQKWASWRNFVAGVLALRENQSASSTVIVLLLLLAAYTIGHLIAPLTKKIQGFGENLAYGKDGKPFEKLPDESLRYAWLRIHCIDAGGHCAKLRAEFTMYNSLAAVFLIFTPVSVLFGPFPVQQTPFLFLALTLMIYRGREARETFSRNVQEFSNSAMQKEGFRSSVVSDKAEQGAQVDKSVSGGPTA